MKPYVLFFNAMLLTACETNDIGQPCPNMEVPNPGSATTDGNVARTEGSEIVEYNVKFPCESIVCVASVGKGAYCSKECTSSGECPGGFECRAVMDYGPFTNETFCVWRECTKDTDCGDPWVMGCKKVKETNVGVPLSFCEFR